ncbi:hypothetical protein HYU96_03795 [Candidatus Daviesbacteria bacterium]|nr:hypothetical protein [Candidatus Daviesbacteria bacterium]
MNESFIDRYTQEVASSLAWRSPEAQQFYVVLYSHTPRDEPRKRAIWPVGREQLLLPDWAGTMMRSIGRGYDYLSLGSRVLMEDAFWHIPMIDFETKNQEQALRTLVELSLPYGYLADSGDSFHYIGSHLISEPGFRRLLRELRKNCRDLGVDRAWVEYLSMDRGMFELRLTSGPEKIKTPTVIAIHELRANGKQIESDRHYGTRRMQ